MTKPKTKIYCSHYDGETYWVVAFITGNFGNIKGYVQPDGVVGERHRYYAEEEAMAAEKLFHKKEELQRLKFWATATQDTAKKPQIETSVGEMREFESGATRNSVEGRLNYVRALSPIVLERYVQYLNAHRKQPDGSMRDFDNWKKGIPTDAYLEGLGRHFMAAWMLAQGFPAEDNHGPVTLEDTLCAIIFGASGWLHEIIKGERGKSFSADDLADALGLDRSCVSPAYKKNMHCLGCKSENCIEDER